ncbi:hypothetical protein BKA60DRAFT_548056 [Fusarium oxysporum]|nr:hypothetical protein BKA60DRAFT_548056 [Fusarium oxysporum]
MDCNTKPIPQVSRCPTCLLITLRDTSQKAISKLFDESPHSRPDPAESELVSYSRPFEIERERHSTLAVLDKNVIKPGVAKPEVNWDRLRQWYTEIPSATDKSNDALPEGFCLVNIPEACLVETDGVQVPNYAT